MKKKLVLVVAVMLIAVTACVLFAGCVPNRPDKFLGTWVTSNKKGLVSEEFGVTTTMGIDGKKMEIKVGETIHVIFEEKSDAFNMYAYNALTGWSAVSITKEKAEENDYFQELKESLTEDEDMIALAEEMQKSFEENYEKDKEGWWSLKNAPTPTAYKVDGNNLLIKANGKEIGTKFVLNYKISIPSEAKKTLNK